VNRSASPNIAELRVDNLHYEINDKLIIAGLSLAVSSGEVLFIEGGNGSGKTTLLRILCGLMQADEGQVSWNGEPLQSAREECYQQLTYIGHATGVKPELSAIENIRFSSAISGLSELTDIQSALDWVDLAGYENSPGRHLSYGQQRRIALSRLLVNPSLLWILDEPFAGLDRKMIEKLQIRFAEHADQGGLLILTSHQPVDLLGLNCKRMQLGT
jgi:heme exporter protein A